MGNKILPGYKEGVLTENVSALAGHKHLKGAKVRYLQVHKIWCNTKQVFVQGNEYHYLDLENNNKVRTPKLLIQ